MVSFSGMDLMENSLVAGALTALVLGTAAADPVVIAHRGASGYLPEHSLAAYAYAHAQGADFLEPDIVLTRDAVPVALHDLYLDAVSNVRERYPGRAREDGLHYAIDFTLAELRGLQLRERIDPATGKARYPGRYPGGTDALFGVVTLEELMRFTMALNQSTGRVVGVYPELKDPAFHAAHGLDIAEIVLAVLARHGCATPADPCLVQSFDPAPLRRLRADLATLPRLVQLLGDPEQAFGPVDYAPMYTAQGMAEIASYADGIGPPLAQLLGAEGPDRMASARAAGLLVHAWTVRVDALPPGWSLEVLFQRLLGDLAVDGLFIDQPDAMVEYRRRLGNEP